MKSFHPRSAVTLGALAAAALLACAPQSQAVDPDEHLPKAVTCQDCPLVLNGHAVRSVWGFDVYLAGLYLAEPTRDENHIMTKDRNGKRVHITMLRGVKSDKFESTIRDNIEVNLTKEERRLYDEELEAFLACFGDGSALKKGDVIMIDYVPEKGTHVTLGNDTFEPIPGDDFYHVLLRLWIGKPPQDSVKEGLLGKES